MTRTSSRRRARAARAALVGVMMSLLTGAALPAATGADSTWDFVYGDPGPDNFSRYQVVRVAPDGSSFLAGFFTGTFHGLTASEVYRSFVQRIDADGSVAWTVYGGDDTFTVIPPVPDLLRDGQGTLYFRNTSGGLGWTALSPAGAVIGSTPAQTADSAAARPVSLSSGGIVQVPFNNLGRVERRDSSLATPVWTFDHSAYFDVNTAPDIAEAPDGSIWLVATKLRTLPTSADSVSMVHLTANGQLINAIRHFNVVTTSTTSTTPSSPILTVGDGFLWLNLLTVEPVTPANNAFPYRRSIWSFATDDGRKLGEVPTTVPYEQIPNGTSVLGCGGLDLTQTFNSNSPSLVARRVVMGGRRLVLFMRCGPHTPGTTVGPAPATENTTQMLAVYAADGPTGTNLRRISTRIVAAGTSISAIDADELGNLVVAGSTTQGIVFSGSTERAPGAEAGAPERAVAVRNPTGNVAALPDYRPVTPVRLFDTRPGEPQGAIIVAKQRYSGAEVLRVKVAGVGGLPASGVGAVSLNVTVAEPASAGFVTVYPCGDRPGSSSLNFVAGQVVPNAVIAPVSATGEICLYSMTPTHLLADVNGWFATGSSFSPVSPVRLFDTRPDTAGLIDVTRTKIVGEQVLRVKVAGVGGLPATGVTAVSLNVTVAEPDAPGFVTVYPCGARPAASNLNFVADQVVPNAVIAPVSAAGEVCFASNVPTHVLADVTGWFGAGAGFRASTPSRLFDTRPDEAQGSVAVAKQQYSGDTVLRVKVVGAGGIPTTGVAAVSLNVTVAEPAGAGFVTVYPCGTRPGASNLNFVAGQVVPNAVIAPVSSSGDICLYSNVPTHLLADVNGWIEA